MNKLRTRDKIVVAIFVIAIVVLMLFAVVPVVYAMVMGPGVRTEGLVADGAEPATTDINGEWQIVIGSPPNSSSVGFTFEELLPGERTVTSGSTQDVTGYVTIEDGVLTAGEVVVDMTDVQTDRAVRDESVRNKLFETSDYPESTFVITEPADVSQLPDDGTVGTVELTGDLTIKGHTNEVTGEMDALRDGDRVIVSGDIIINRHDYGVESPEFIAAEIADEGEVNIRLALSKEGQ